MQRADEQKRKRIIEIAGRLFTERPFYDVRLEDVAAEAHIGKGTLYVYFSSKSDLCRSLIYEELVGAIAEARQAVAAEGLSSVERIDRLVRCLVAFARRRVYLRSLERELGLGPDQLRELHEKRAELLSVIEEALRTGVARGEFDDPQPQLTARYILAILREITFFPTPELSDEMCVDHLVEFLNQGIARKGSP